MIKQNKKSSTIIDVANTAGVSPATVSRVFNRQPYVKEDIRNAVLAAAKELNYAPKSTKSKNTFGILVHGEKYLGLGSYETQLIIGISGEFFKNGYTTEITTDQQTSFFHRNTFRALIVLTSIDQNIIDLGIPIVLVNNRCEGIHSVVTDHFQGIELAVEHLHSAGHKRIGYISGGSETWGDKERLRGYRQTLQKNGLDTDDGLCQFTEKTGVEEATAELLKLNPTAIILSGEGRAQQLSYALHKAGKRIPEDISVITFEDSNVTPYLTPPHTTISQNIPGLSQAATELALHVAVSGGSKYVQSVILKNELIVRESVADLNSIDD
jgi:DNA-binding LacI/PurR family transcriptional regulator